MVNFSFIKGVSHTFLAQGISALFQIFIGIITARYLGAEGRGLYSLFFSVAAIGANFAYLGMSQATVYFRNRENIANNILYGNVIVVFLFQSLFLAIVLFYLPDDVLVKLIGSDSPVMAQVIWFILVILLADILLTGMVLSNHNFLLYSLYILFQSLFILLATLPLIFIPITGEYAIIIRVSVVGILLFLYWLVVLKKLELGGFIINFNLLKRQLKFGFKSFLQNLIGLLNYRILLLLLGLMSSISDVAMFSVALLLVEVIRFVPNTIGTVLLPKLTTLKGRELIKFSTRTLRIVITVNLVITPIIFYYAEWIILFLFGDEYSASVSVARILLIGGFFGLVYQVLTRVFTSESKQKISIISASLGLFISIVLTFLLVPGQGVDGAAFGFLFGSLFTAIIMLVSFCRAYQVSLIYVLIPTKDDFRFVYKKMYYAINYWRLKV